MVSAFIYQSFLLKVTKAFVNSFVIYISLKLLDGLLSLADKIFDDES